MAKYTVQQFGQKIKQQYPAYSHMDDTQLAQKVLEQYPQYQSSIQWDQPQQPQSSGNPIHDLVSSVVKPFQQTGKTIAGAGFEVGRAADQAVGSPVAHAMGNSDDYLQKNGQVVNNPFLGQQDLQQYDQNPGQAITNQAKASVGVAANAVPFGKGASILTKVLLPGAGMGAMQAISNDQNPVEGAAMGAAGAGILGKAGSLVGGVLKGAGNQLDAAGSQFLKAQYNVGRGVADKQQLGNTVDQLKNLGFYNINDVAKVAPLVTGHDGVLNQFVQESVAHAMPVDTGGLTQKVLPSIIEQKGASLTGGEKKSIQDFMNRSIMKMATPNVGPGGGDPAQAFKVIQDLEKQGQYYAGQKSPNGQQIGQVYNGMANELKTRLFDHAGANDVLVHNVLSQNSPAFQQLQQVAPKVANAVKNAKTIKEVRALEAPFVRGDILQGESANANINKPFNLRDFIAGMAGNALVPGIGLATPLALRLAGSDAGLSTAGRAAGAMGNGLNKVGNPVSKLNPVDLIAALQNMKIGK